MGTHTVEVTVAGVTKPLSGRSHMRKKCPGVRGGHWRGASAGRFMCLGRRGFGRGRRRAVRMDASSRTPRSIRHTSDSVQAPLGVSHHRSRPHSGTETAVHSCSCSRLPRRLDRLLHPYERRRPLDGAADRRFGPTAAQSRLLLLYEESTRAPRSRGALAGTPHERRQRPDDF